MSETRIAVILLRVKRMPDKDSLVKAFNSLFYREPTVEEFDTIKLDMNDEYVIVLI